MKLYKRKGSPYYYVRQGETLISLKTTRKAYALQLLEEYQAKRLGIYRVVHKRASDFFEPYLAHCRKYNKGTTIEDKERTLNFFKEQAGDPWLRQINKKLVVDYLDSRIASRSGEPISAERFNTERQVLNNFFNYLIGEKVLKENPAKEIEKKKIVRNKEPKSLPRDTEKKLDKWLAENSEELLRVKAVAVNTGLRARELVNLTWPDIDGDILRVTAKPDWTPKDYEERAIPLNKTATSALKQHKMKRGVLGRYVFCRLDGRKYGRGLDLAMVRAFKAAELGSGGLHSLRHTFATRYLDAGGNVKDLQKLMGHSDLKTTQRYLHADEEQMKKIVERMK